MGQYEFRWTLLRQALLQKKAKTMLIVLAVAMGASVVTALMNLQADLRYRMSRELRDYGPNVILLPDSGSSATTKKELLDSLHGGGFTGELLAFTPELFVPVQVNGISTILVGSEMKSLQKLYPNWKLSGSVSGSGSGEPTALLGVRLAGKLRLQPGERIGVNASGKQYGFVVGGMVESGESEDDQIFVEIRRAQEIGGATEDFHIVALSIVGEIPTVQKQLESFVRPHPGIRFQLVRKIAAAESLILDKVSRLMGIVISLILLILFFCIHTTVSAILLFRQKEIALFRVLGARRRQLMSELTLELLILGLIGGLVGYVVGTIMAQILGKALFQTFIIPRVRILILTIFSSLALMVISSILPIRRAINRQAAVVFKEA